MPLLFHAPGVHVGGGLQLLRSLLKGDSDAVAWAQLDIRAKNELQLTVESQVHWVARSALSRLFAEWRLYRFSTASDTVLCFHGLPPLWRLRSRVVVFVQNRILFESGSLAAYPILTRMRLWVERGWTRLLSSHSNRYIVQSPSMAVIVRHCLGGGVDISISPYMPAIDSLLRSKKCETKRKFDFVYVASGDAHKNHHNLILAWRILAEAGLRPFLALTINATAYPLLIAEIEDARQKFALNIENLDTLASDAITDLYQSSSALIFPSRVESLGMPLIEASRLGLPVLAPELDYVRDVISPAETFDPDSPTSIARAVRRFLNNPEPSILIRTPEEFMAEVQR
jgi:glycosyltransferase involved in cell wall biosynthesis